VQDEGEEGDAHKWAIPSAISPEKHKMITVRQSLHHLGFFFSDDALESKKRTFFAQRTTTALSNVSHLTDSLDPSCVILDPASQADLMDSLRFSTHKLIENLIQPLTDQEHQASDDDPSFIVLTETKFSSLHSWTFAPMVSPFTRRANDWQFT
jgi:hypothetical protein